MEPCRHEESGNAVRRGIDGIAHPRHVGVAGPALGSFSSPMLYCNDLRPHLPHPHPLFSKYRPEPIANMDTQESEFWREIHSVLEACMRSSGCNALCIRWMSRLPGTGTLCAGWCGLRQLAGRLSGAEQAVRQPGTIAANRPWLAV